MSITRILSFYVKAHDFNNLITFDDLKRINNNYKEYLKK